MTQDNTARGFNFTLGVNVTNLLNHFNPAGYQGVITSPILDPTSIDPDWRRTECSRPDRQQSPYRVRFAIYVLSPPAPEVELDVNPVFHSQVNRPGFAASVPGYGIRSARWPLPRPCRCCEPRIRRS